MQDAAALRKAGKTRLLGLFADEDLDFEIDRNPNEPSTAEMAAAALRVLEGNSPNGFVLFVENENTDTAGHRNDAAALMHALWALDDALQVALDFQRRTPNETLIIVTGDHETGGFSMTYALKDLSFALEQQSLVSRERAARHAGRHSHVARESARAARPETHCRHAE